MHQIVVARLTEPGAEHNETAGEIEVLRGQLELLRARRPALAEEICRQEVEDQREGRPTRH